MKRILRGPLSFTTGLNIVLKLYLGMVVFHMCYILYCRGVSRLLQLWTVAQQLFRQLSRVESKSYKFGFTFKYVESENLKQKSRSARF